MDKPITIMREEFFESIAKIIGDSRLPAFVMEAVLREIISQVNAAAQQQYEADKKAYEASLELQEES